MNNCIAILGRSLEKKIEVLKKIQTYNDVQEEAFSKSVPDLGSFDEAIAQKDALIEELVKLDDGFEALYEDCKQELENNRAQYAPQIKELQEQIKEVTELSNAVQAKEARNKKLIEDYFARQKESIKSGRQQSKAAYDYYKNMSASTVRQATALWEVKK